MAVVVVVTHSNFKCHGHDRFRLRARLISFVKYKGGGKSCFYERNLKRLTNCDRYNIIIRYRNEKRKRISEKTTRDEYKNRSMTLPYINIIIIRIYTYIFWLPILKEVYFTPTKCTSHVFTRCARTEHKTLQTNFRWICIHII